MNKTKIGLFISSDTGAVRKNNEDNFTVNGKIRHLDNKNINISGIIALDRVSMLGVFDGMGGEEMGDVASEIGAQLSGNLLHMLDSGIESDFDDIINDYVNSSNNQICKCLNNNGSKRGGTTFALVYFRDGMIYPYSLGDSRIYIFTNGKLNQITVDHTLAMKKYKANIYTLEEAQKSPDSHKLTLFLGVDVDEDGLSAEKYAPFPIPSKGKLLICSDGLYDMCDHDTIVQILSERHENYSAELVRQAKQNGGIDNITCIVADFD